MIEMTILDNPHSQNQCYRLTQAGPEFLMQSKK